LEEGKDKLSLSLEEVGKDGRHISIYLKGTFLVFFGSLLKVKFGIYIFRICFGEELGKYIIVV
jgi:hypothetical protein